MQLLNHFTFDQNASDITGFAQDGREIAVVGLQNATSLVDITDPANPFEIDRINGSNSIWRDVKYWDGYVFIGTEADDGIKVVNVNNLDEPELIYTISDIDNSHNIHVNEGYLYIVGADDHDIWIYDLMITPGTPELIGTWNGEYIHDLHVYNNKAYAMGIYSSTAYIIDLTDKSNPQTIVSWQYDGFAHDCAVTEDENFLITADEMLGGHLKIWDISDYSNINLLSEFSVNLDHSIHNVYVIDRTIYCSYYADGTRVIDMSDPYNPLEIGYYDTSEFEGLYVGNWGVYPFLPSGNIISSDMETGLYITKLGGISINHENIEDMNFSAEPILFPVNVLSFEGEITDVDLHYNIGSDWIIESLILQNDNVYSIEIPSLPSGTFVHYYFTAENNIGDATVYPLGGNQNPIMFIYGDLPDIFNDNFETDMGWTTPASDDDATSGLWERGEPIGTFVSNAPVQPENDNSTDGEMCFITGNQTNPNSAGQNDVDGGKTSILSPIFDLSNYSDVLVTYWRWYTNNMGNNASTDHWLVDVSSDSGTSWISLENTTISHTEWIRNRVLLSDYIQLTSGVQFRFVAEDIYYDGNVGSGGSLVEAGLDDFKLEAVDFNIMLGDLNMDSNINILDVILIVGIIIEDFIPSEYEINVADLNNDGIINILDIVSIVNIIIG